MSDARGIDRRTAQRLGVALRKSEADAGPPLLHQETKDLSQRMQRVKLLESLTDAGSATGLLQIQNAAGGIAWVDAAAKIPGIYKGHPEQPDFAVNDIIWIAAFRNRWYVVSSQSTGESLEGNDCPCCCKPCICPPETPVEDCGDLELPDEFSVPGLDATPFALPGNLVHDTGCLYITDDFNVTTCEGLAAEEDHGDFYWKFVPAFAKDAAVLSLHDADDDSEVMRFTNDRPFDELCKTPFSLATMRHEITAIFGNQATLTPCTLCVEPVGDECDPCELDPPTSTCIDALATQVGRTDPWPNTITVDGNAFNWNPATERWEYTGSMTIGACSGNILATIVCGGSSGFRYLNLGDVDPNTQADPKLDIVGGTLGPTAGGYDPITLQFTKRANTISGGFTTCTGSDTVLTCSE